MKIQGKFADAVSQGRVFSVSTVVAGLAIPISTTTAPSVLLWNPEDSGVLVNLLRYSIAYVSGTSVAGAISMQTIAGVSRTAVNSQITVFAKSEPLNAIVGAGAASHVRASAAGTNTIVATTRITSPMFTISALIATTAMNPVSTSYDFDGLVQLYPSMAVFPVGSAASGALYMQTLYWEEIPLVDVNV